MPDNPSNISEPYSTLLSLPADLDLGYTTYHYDADRHRLSWTDAPLDPALRPQDDSDQPLFLATPSAPNAVPQVADSHSYHWSGQELETEIALHYNRVGPCCDPTPGAWLNEDV